MHNAEDAEETQRTQRRFFVGAQSMTADTAKIVDQTLSLPPNVRAFLAERLIESLDWRDDGELSPEWRAEVRRRCVQLDSDAVVLRDADDVFADAFAALE